MFRGLKPRVYRANDPEDCIIFEENQAVEELLFMLTGTVSVGFSRLTFFSNAEGPYVWKARFTGRSALCAYYVLSNTECDFIHKASEDVSGFALDFKFIHQDLFEKGNRYTDQFEIMRSASWAWHRRNIYTTCSTARKEYLSTAKFKLKRNRITIRTKDKMIALSAHQGDSINGEKINYND